MGGGRCAAKVCGLGVFLPPQGHVRYYGRARERPKLIVAISPPDYCTLRFVASASLLDATAIL